MRTPVVNLGESGLASPGLLAFRLYLEDGDAPVAINSSAVTAHELGSAADYYFDGIDLADGRAARLVVARAAEPLLALTTVPVSAPSPPPVVVYRRELLLDPLGPVTQHDTLGAISIVIRSGLPEDPVGAGYRATFSLRPAADPALILDRVPAAISDPIFDAITSSWGTTISYQLTAPATASPGLLLGTFRIITDGGAIKTLTVPPLEIRVLPDIGG